MNAIEKLRELADKVPGYRGYRDLESRRASDRALREATADAFQSQLTRLGRVQEQAMMRGDFESVDSLDQIMNRLRHLVDRLRTASEGYGGLFSDAPVREEALERLYDFDFAFARGIEKVADQIVQMGGNQPTASVLPGLMQTLDDLHAQMDGRQALLSRPSEARPAMDEQPGQAAQEWRPAAQAPETPVAPPAAPAPPHGGEPWSPGAPESSSPPSAMPLDEPAPHRDAASDGSDWSPATERDADRGTSGEAPHSETWR